MIVTDLVHTKPHEALKRWPRLCAHVIAESLGYASPRLAAQIVNAVHTGEHRQAICEWICACFGGDPVKAVQTAIRNRHYHKGFMSSYQAARKLVELAVERQVEPLFGSWF